MTSADFRILTATFSLAATITFAQQTQTPNPKPAAPETPIPSGEQTDGAFHKVILDADQQIDGVWKDTVVDPMELAVAKDGRVFYAQRNGVIKMWKPDAKGTIRSEERRV